jgi:hypothetical protein
MSHSIGNETTVDRSDVNNDACADNLLLAEQLQLLERLKEARSGPDLAARSNEKQAEILANQDEIFKRIDFDAIKRYMAATPFVGSAFHSLTDPTSDSENGSRRSSTSRSRSLSRSRSRDSITPSSITTSRASRSFAVRGRSRTRKKLFTPEYLRTKSSSKTGSNRSITTRKRQNGHLHEKHHKLTTYFTPREKRRHPKNSVYDTESRRELEDHTPKYSTRSKYKYNRSGEPSFEGAETEFMDFSKKMMAYLRRRGIPNHFEEYYEHRALYEEMTTEEIVADREIYDIFTTCLGGTATVHTDKHSDTCSGHFVWIELVETFLKRSGARRTQVHEELDALEWKGSRAESLPQFFKKFNKLVEKFRAVGGHMDETTVVSKLSQVFV